MSNKNKEKNSDQSEVNIDLSNIPMHTMRDDLDELEGKIAPKRVESPVDETKKDSPFLEASMSEKADEKKTQLEMQKNKSMDMPQKSLIEPQIEIYADTAAGPEKTQEQAYDTAPLKIIEENDNVDTQKILTYQKKSVVKYVVIGLLVVVIAGAMGLGYYYWTNKQAEIAVTAPIEEVEPTLEPEAEVVPVYSVDEVNYVTIDVENDDEQTIQTILKNIADQIKLDNSMEPVEFVFADVNGNLISFPIFSLIFGINLPMDVMDNLEEDFTMYLYNDNGNMRVGMDMHIKGEQGNFAQLLLNNESILPDALNALFLSNPMNEIQKNNPFQDGSYGVFSTRYLNLNQENTLSVDYAVVNGRFIIGTSKDAIRAILDEVQDKVYSDTFQTEAETEVDQVAQPAVEQPEAVNQNSESLTEIENLKNSIFEESMP